MPPTPRRPAALSGRVFRGREAVRHGLITPDHLRSRAWIRLRHDVYADARLARDHELACRAALARLRPTAVLAGPSAAFLHGVEHAAGYEDDVHVITPPTDRVGTQRGSGTSPTVAPSPAECASTSCGRARPPGSDPRVVPTVESLPWSRRPLARRADQLHRDRRRLNHLVAAGWAVLHVTAHRMHSDFPRVLHELRTTLTARGWCPRARPALDPAHFQQRWALNCRRKPAFLENGRWSERGQGWVMRRTSRASSSCASVSLPDVDVAAVDHHLADRPAWWPAPPWRSRRPRRSRGSG